ncbi:uncharacterized protein TNCV_846201 [Trichonephila clavipes]|nr:uncharacterized protein TNCV_846201 [Trichonephila clavipes]
MGTRLRRLKAQLKGQILSDGKCLSGKNRLTEHEIDNLQSYYGSAIRRNHSSVQNMRQAIWAIFLHKLSADEYPQHGFCPIGKIHGVDLKRLKHQIETLSLGVYDAVCSFNYGNVSKLKMLQKMGVEPGGIFTTRELLATDHVILNHGQVTWTTPELAPPLLTITPHQREDISALDRFNVHRCPTRRVFSGTGIEPVTKQATVRYLYHSATAAT